MGESKTTTVKNINKLIICSDTDISNIWQIVIIYVKELEKKLQCN